MAEDAEITARITADPTPFLDAVRRAEESAHGLEKAAKEVSTSVGRSMDATTSRVGQMARQVQATTDRVSMAFARMMPVQMMARTAKDMASKVYEVAMGMARLADDAADTHAYLKRTFGSLSGEATAWAKETSRAYGVYSAQVESYYTRLYEALSASGMGSRVAEEYAQELTKLRYDLSAVLKWYSEDQISEWVTKVAAEGNEEAFKKLMAGQSFEEAAKKAGLWSASMDAASKKAAMAKLLMSEYSDEIGAWSANLNTASGAEARLSASIDELQTKIGQVLSPVLAGVLNLISDVVDGINGFADAIGRLTGAVETVDKAALVREVADAMSMLADSTEAASEASAGLAGFDRLNRLSTGDGEGEQSKGLDLSSGLDSWMRLWEVDAETATTAADALWDSVLDSGLSTEEELRSRYGDLFGWMADQSDVDMELRTDAVEDAWQGLETIVSQYQDALRGIGVDADRLQKARAGAQAHSQAQAQEKALLSKLDRLKAGRGSEEDVADIERELEDVRRTLKDTSADAKLYQAVVQLRTAYGTGIQGLYGTLAQDLGTYSGSIVAQLSEHTTQELSGAESAIAEAFSDLPSYSDADLRKDIDQWLEDNSEAVTDAIDDLPVGSDITDILEAFEREGIDVSDPSAVLAADALARIAGDGEEQKGTLGEIVDGLGGVSTAVSSVAAYDDTQLRLDAAKWLEDNRTKIKEVLKDVPTGASLTTILSEFEAAGIDVSDAGAVTAVNLLKDKISNYDDTTLRTDVSQWLSDNEAAVTEAIGKLPAGSEVADILTAFEEAGIDVSDESARDAAGLLETIGKAYGGPTTLKSIVDGLGGVEEAVGGIAPYDDEGLRKDLDQWLADNGTAVADALGKLPAGSDITKILTEFEAQGIDVTEASASEAAGYLETIGKAYQGTATLGGLVDALGGVQGAVGGISFPAYSDSDLRKDLDQWLSTNATTVETAINGLPKDSDLTRILTEFESAGIDVSDPSAVLAASQLETIGKAYQGTATLGGVVDALGGVETAVGGIASYDDSGLSKSLDQWLQTNASTVTTAISGLPKGADITKILTEFESAGIDVSDANAQAAAGYLETIGKAYSGQTTLGGIVTALGGVQEAVGGISIPAYDDTELSKSLDQWLQTNASTVSTAISGLPKDADITKILTSFEAAGIDVKDASAVLAASRLATISQAYSGQTTIGDIVEGLGGVSEAVGGLDVSPTVTVNEPDYSQVVENALKELGDPTVNVHVDPPHVDVAAPSVTVNAPDYSPVLEQTLENTAQMKAKLEQLRLVADERASEEAKRKYEEAQKKATEEAAKAAQEMTKVWSSLSERAPAVADLVGSAVSGIADMVAAQDELRDIETREAEQGLPDSVVAMLSKLGNTDNRTEIREALMAGKSWYQLNALYRRNAQGAGITSSEWASAVAAVKAMPAQTPAPAQTPSQNTSYWGRRSSLPQDPYGATVARYEEMGKDWSELRPDIREWYASHGITGYAQGGVFEPNSPVLAVLGDNRTEKEVAAPYSTIVKAVKEALGSASSGASQTIQIVANVVMDGRTVAKATFPYLREESRRLGVGI